MVDDSKLKIATSPVAPVAHSTISRRDTTHDDLNIGNKCLYPVVSLSTETNRKKQSEASHQFAYLILLIVSGYISKGLAAN